MDSKTIHQTGVTLARVRLRPGMKLKVASNGQSTLKSRQVHVNMVRLPASKPCAWQLQTSIMRTIGVEKKANIRGKTFVYVKYYQRQTS